MDSHLGKDFERIKREFDEEKQKLLGEINGKKRELEAEKARQKTLANEVEQNKAKVHELEKVVEHYNEELKKIEREFAGHH